MTTSMTWLGNAMRRLLPAAMGLALAVSLAGPVGAMPAREGAHDGFIHAIRHLSRFSGGDIWLKGSKASAVITIPVSHRIRVRHAHLHLAFDNSSALIEPRSQLVVLLNGRVVGEQALSSALNRNEMDIEIDGEALTPGFDKLELRAAQHYTLQCEDGWSSELWTRVRGDASFLEMDFEELPVHPTLRDLDQLLDARAWDSLPLVIMTPEGEKLDARKRRLGAMLAQAAALHARFLPLHIAFGRASRGRLPRPDMDAILFGEDRAVNAVLGGAAIQGDGIRIMPRPDNPRRFLLVIAGKDAAGLEKSVAAFAAMRQALTDMSSSQVRKVETPKGRAIKPLEADAIYTFARLGLNTRTLRGPRGVFPLSIWMAPDMFSRAPLSVVTRLHFAYGAGLREDSSLGIYVNGVFAKSIPLDQRGGMDVRDYRVAVPLSLFRPGENRLEFRAVLNPLVTGKCRAEYTDSLLLTMHGDSTIALPAVDHFARMPDLALMARTGFPFVNRPDRPDAATNVLLADASGDALAASWTLLAKLAQLQGSVAPVRYVTPGEAEDADPLLLVGAAGKIADDWWSKAPVSFSPKGPGANYVESGNSLLRGSGRSGVSLLRDKMFGGRMPDNDTLVAHISQSLSLGRANLLMQFGEDDQTVTLLTSRSDAGVLDAAWSLVDYGMWGGLSGDTVSWLGDGQGQGRRVALKLAPTYYLSGMNPLRKLMFEIAEHPVLLVLALLLLAVLIVTALKQVILILHRKRHG